MAIDFSKILGVIFDMDGVLVDSEAVMANASVMGMADYKIYAKPEDFVPYFGTNEETYFGSVVRMHGGIYTKEIAEHIYDIYCDIAPSQIITFPKVPETLSELHKRGYKTAIASSSIKRKLDVNITSAKIDLSCLDAVVCGSDVKNRKPNPEIFLTAAAKLGLKPENCLVAEDAISGVKAAKAAGMYCFGVTTTFDKAFFKELGADLAGESITDILGFLP